MRGTVEAPVAVKGFDTTLPHKVGFPGTILEADASEFTGADIAAYKLGVVPLLQEKHSSPRSRLNSLKKQPGLVSSSGSLLNGHSLSISEPNLKTNTEETKDPGVVFANARGSERFRSRRVLRRRGRKRSNRCTCPRGAMNTRSGNCSAHGGGFERYI